MFAGKAERAARVLVTSSQAPALAPAYEVAVDNAC